MAPPPRSSSSSLSSLTTLSSSDGRASPPLLRPTPTRTLLVPNASEHADVLGQLIIDSNSVHVEDAADDLADNSEQANVEQDDRVKVKSETLSTGHSAHGAAQVDVEEGQIDVRIDADATENAQLQVDDEIQQFPPLTLPQTKSSSPPPAATCRSSVRHEDSYRPSLPPQDADWRSPSLPEPIGPPLLTPRSQQAVNNFRADRFAYPHPAMPPPHAAVHQYSIVLPSTRLGGYLIGRGGETAKAIRKDSGAGDFQVLFRQDGLAFAVITGCKSAIKTALAIVKAKAREDDIHGYREDTRLGQAGTSWCEYKEIEIDLLPGYWLKDEFAEPMWSGERGQMQAPDEHAGHDASSRTGGRSASDPAQDRYAASRRSQPDARSSTRDDRPRGRPSQTADRRTPSCMPDYRDYGSLKRSKEASPRYDEREPKRRDRARSFTRSPFRSRSRSPPRKRLSVSSSKARKTDEEPPSAYTRPIPISAIELFVGPKASGHFIEQTTGVRLIIESDLNGASLRIHAGSATQESFEEALRLVDRVFKGWENPQPGGARKAAERSRRAGRDEEESPRKDRARSPARSRYRDERSRDRRRDSRDEEDRFEPRERHRLGTSPKRKRDERGGGRGTGGGLGDGGRRDRRDSGWKEDSRYEGTDGGQEGSSRVGTTRRSQHSPTRTRRDQSRSPRRPAPDASDRWARPASPRYISEGYPPPGATTPRFDVGGAPLHNQPRGGFVHWQSGVEEHGSTDLAAQNVREWDRRNAEQRMRADVDSNSAWHRRQGWYPSGEPRNEQRWDIMNRRRSAY